MHATIDTYAAPNKTFSELHEVVKSGKRTRSTEGFRRGGAGRTVLA